MTRNGEAFAYLGDINPAERITDIQRVAHTLLWGIGIKDVLLQIKTEIPNPLVLHGQLLLSL